MDIDDDDEAFLYGESPVPAVPTPDLRSSHENNGSAAVNTTLADTSSGQTSWTSGGIDVIVKHSEAASALEASIAATLASQGIPQYTPTPSQAGPSGSNGNAYASNSGVPDEEDEDEHEEAEEEESDDDLDIVVNAPNKYNVDFRNPQARQQAPNMVVSGMGLTAASLAKSLVPPPTVSSTNSATISAPPGNGLTLNGVQNGPMSVGRVGQPQAGNVLAAPKPLETEPPVNVGASTGAPSQATADPSSMINNGISGLPLLPPSDLPPAHAATNAPAIPAFPLLEPPLIKDGRTIYEFDLKSFEGSGQPWRRRGADLSRWFNYGFDEESWVRYLDFRRGMVMGVEGLNSMPPGSMLPPNIADMLHIPQQPGMNGMNGMPGMPGMDSMGMGGFPSNPEQMQQMMMQMQSMMGVGGGGGANMMDMGAMGNMGNMMGMPGMSTTGLQGMPGMPNMVGMGGMSPAPNAIVGTPAGVQNGTPGPVTEEGGESGALAAAGPSGTNGGITPFVNPMLGMATSGFNPNMGLPNQVVGAPMGPGGFRGGMARGRGFVRGAAPLRGRGGMPLPTGPRAAVAGPIAAIPTGPRAQRVQRDRDQIAPSEIELDYGGGDFPTPAEAAAKTRKSESKERRGGKSGKDSKLDEFGRAKRADSEEYGSRDRDSSYSPPPRTRRDSRSPERRRNTPAEDREDEDEGKRRASLSEADAESVAPKEEGSHEASPAKPEAKKEDAKKSSSTREKSSKSGHHRSERDKEHRSDRHRSSRDDDKHRSSRDKDKDKDTEKDKHRSSRDGGSRRSSRSRERESRKDGTREHKTSGTTSRSHRRSREREHRSSKTHTSSSSKKDPVDKVKDERESDAGSIGGKRRNSKDEDQSRKRSRSPSADREADTARASRSKKR